MFDRTQQALQRVSILKYFTEFLAMLILIILSCLVILFVSIFPVFIKVYRANKEREKETAVFPIVNHFYNFIKMYYLAAFVLLLLAVLLLLTGNKNTVFLSQMILYWKLAAISLFSIFVHVNHIIIFLLSLQRFILLFFPSSESYVRLFEKRTSAVIFALYFILSLLNLSFLVWTMSSAGKDFLKVKVYVVYFVFVNCILLSSAALYIPIVLSIRKYSQLSSSVQNQPQKYILYQTFFLAMFKAWIILCGIFDAISTPVLIQASYLCCNQRNVKSLSKAFSIFNIRSLRISPVILKSDNTTFANTETKF
ncbi:hypothetical protein CRE_05024 [Caenorhabditis remanei]|uniref:Serpentine receptor class gamma n=1 Tax=Caenorhabditis remanei TaxID=31234 RepID=E3MZ30_CAERE|nr:hypothetical protein CRE_05024 [Caenorhabditis remanei]